MSDGTLIERVSSSKYLGIWIDEKLSFNVHIYNKRFVVQRTLTDTTVITRDNKPSKLSVSVTVIVCQGR